MSLPENKFSLVYVGGGLSGICGVILSHPFDTIKTNFQANKKMILKPNLQTFKNLYKGITPPIIGVGLEKSIVFGTYELTKHFLDKKNNNDYINTALSGACSGLSASVIVTPFERIKILLQTNNFKMNAIPLNPKFYFRGLSATFTRETPGFAIYFSLYEYLKKKYYLDHGISITPQGSFLFGGLAGTFSWIFIYPQDRIKTEMQAKMNNNTFLKILTKIYREEGILSFYKGFHYALMRAIPLHAGTFMTMEIIKKYLNKE